MTSDSTTLSREVYIRDVLRPKVKFYLGKGVTYGLLIIFSLWFVLPLFWMVMTSFMPREQVGIFPPEWIPRVWMFEN
ncbi:hypothetical protein ACFLYO_11260, partial [Chloroflexota bacterium]